MRLKKLGHVYHAHFNSASGKPTSVTTRCTDLAEARKVVKESGLADLETAAKAGRLTREAIGHITVGCKLTMAKALVEFEKYLVAISRSPKTVINTVTAIRAWLREAKIETTPPSAITEANVSKWINNPRSESKAGTRRMDLSALNSLFVWLTAKGYCLGNPAALVRVNLDVMDHQQRERRVTEPMTSEDIKQIVADCDKRGDLFWSFATRCAHETGLRLGDICNLEWSCFEKDRTITLWTGKRDKRLELPISKALAHLVTEIPVSDAKYLFPDQHRTYANLKRRSYLSLQYGRLCQRLGITGKSFHSIRHGVATDKFAKADKAELAKKLAETLTVGQIAQLLGHSNSGTTKGYIH